MSRSLFLALTFLFVACTEKKVEQLPVASSSEVKTNSGNGKNLPPGAVAIDTDLKDMKRVELRDGAGNILQKGFLFEGNRTGSWSEYFPDGKLKSITPFVNDLKEGLFVEFNNSGQIVKRCEYHNDLRHGEYFELNYAQMKESRLYQNGKIEGLVKIFYDNGKIMEEGLYKNGLRDGTSKWYDQDGKLSIQYEYKAGELIKK